MSSIFFPPGLQAAISGKFAQEQATLGKGFDALLSLRTDEQAAARELFKTLAAANPQLASFVMTNTSLAKDLSATPTTIPKKGEKPFGERVREAFSEAATAKLPDLFTPEQRRQAMNDARKGVTAAISNSANTKTGEPTLAFSPEEVETLARAQLLGDFTEAKEILGEEKLSAYLNTPEGSTLSLEAMVVRTLQESGALEGLSEAELVQLLTDISARLRGDPSEIAAIKMQVAEIKRKQTINDFQNDLRELREGRLLDDDEREKIKDDLSGLKALEQAGKRFVDGMRVALDKMDRGEPIPFAEKSLLIGLALTYDSPQAAEMPLLQMLTTGQISEDVILLFEQELVETRARIDAKEKRLKKGRDVGLDEEKERKDAAAAAEKESKNGGGEPAPSPTVTDEDADALAQEILDSIDEELKKKLGQ